MTKTVKYITARVFILSIVLVSFAPIYKTCFWEDEISRESPLFTKMIQFADSCDVFYYGESSNITVDDKDSLRSSISDLIGLQTPKYKICDFSQPGAHAHFYLDMIKHIPEHARVKTMIVTMNLRSFTASWIYSQLERSLAKKMLLFQERPPYINKLLLNFGAYSFKNNDQFQQEMLEHWQIDTLVFPFEYPYKTVREWDDAMALRVFYDSTGKADKAKNALACNYVKTYAFQIDTLTNPRIKDFDQIVEIAKEKKLNLIFNLVAENIEEADSLAGPALVYLMKQNRDLLVSRYNKGNVIVVDNMEVVPSREFIDRQWTTEHYFYPGRAIIAKNVADYLKMMMDKKAKVNS